MKTRAKEREGQAGTSESTNQNELIDTNSGTNTDINNSIERVQWNDNADEYGLN